MLGLDRAAPFPEELHTHLGELSASGNGYLQITLQTANATERAQPLENWAPRAGCREQKENERPAVSGLSKVWVSRCLAADAS